MCGKRRKTTGERFKRKNQANRMKKRREKLKSAKEITKMKDREKQDIMSGDTLRNTTFEVQDENLEF